MYIVSQFMGASREEMSRSLGVGSYVHYGYWMAQNDLKSVVTFSLGKRG